MTKTELFKISEIELTYKNKVKASQRVKITSSRHAYALFRQNWNDLTIDLYEEFKILLLDRGNHCIGIVPISKGGVSGTYVDPKLIFTCALKANSSAIILGHNHPSGNLTPSKADKSLTTKLINGGRFLDIQILDHLIITDESYLSFADKNFTDIPHLSL